MTEIYDLVIIGSGPAGISAALAVTQNSRSKVLLIESGLGSVDEKHQELNRAEIDVGGAKGWWPFDQSRLRALGGTSNHWSGRVAPLWPHELKTANAEWPILHEDLAAYYERALQLCDAGPNAFAETQSLFDGLPEPSDSVLSRHFQWGPPVRFGDQYGQKLRERGVRIVLDRTVVSVECSGLAVSAVLCRSTGGTVERYAGRFFILAAGTIENSRLLLTNDSVLENIPPAARQNIGRYYSPHCLYKVGTVYPLGDDGALAQYRNIIQQRDFLGHQVRCAPYFQLTRSASGLLPSGYAQLGERDWFPTGGERAIRELRDALEGEGSTWQALQDLLLNFPGVMEAAYGRLFGRDEAEGYPLIIQIGSAARAENRITLSEGTDWSGMRSASVYWRPGAAEKEAAKQLSIRVAGYLTDVLSAKVRLDEWVLSSDSPEWVDLSNQGGHDYGGTLAAGTPSEGVVDANLKVFGLNNLYVASASVFPTVGAANPTLTIVALALRLGKHLSARMP